jgi:hypothetical protein
MLEGRQKAISNFVVAIQRSTQIMRIRDGLFHVRLRELAEVYKCFDLQEILDAH